MQPPGFTYRPDFVSQAEEANLLRVIGALEFDKFVMRGVEARREVLHYGYLYGYDSYKLEEGPPIPEFLMPLRSRAANESGTPEDEWEEALITRYPPGATIGWHRDAPMFGPVVVGISLGAPCEMRFRKGSTGRTAFKAVLEPRSFYVIAGEARTGWQHSIPAVKETRYSITFRTLKSRRRSSAPARGSSRPEDPAHPSGQ